MKNVNGVTDSVTVTGGGATTVTTLGSTVTVTTPQSQSVPAGTFVLGKPNDTTLIGAGFMETGFTQDFWRATSTAGAPTKRFSNSVVWTGSKMIVWGGFDFVNFLNTGGRYDPVADSWTGTTTTGAPSVRDQHTVVWTGTKMVVWGGYDGTVRNTGGQYDPVGDSWTATTIAGAPTGRYLQTAVWTGSKMIVWGGNDLTNDLSTGGLYDPGTGPGTDSWLATGAGAVPTGRRNHTAVWTGTKMVVWGGFDGALTNTGGRYDPVLNFWTGGTTTFGAPTGREQHTAVWTGTKMVVWGGEGGVGGPLLNTGGQWIVLSLYMKN